MLALGDEPAMAIVDFMLDTSPPFPAASCENPGVPRRPPPKKSAERPQARLAAGGRVHYLGRWDDRAAVDLAVERASLYFGLAKSISRRARTLGPASPEALRREARLAHRKRASTSRFEGVSWSSQGQRWVAIVAQPGSKKRGFIGFFEDEEEAAVAVDRVSRHLGLKNLNFPERKLAPMSIEDLKRSRQDARKKETTSRYVGVVYEEERGTRPWVFYLKGRAGRVAIGGYATEREAAIARDRAALFYHRESQRVLNLPDAALALGPADFATLRREVHAVRKATTTSRYLGVSWQVSHRRWVAHINVQGKLEVLGYYEDEEEAGLSYDRVALHVLGAKAKRNFPRRVLVPISPEELRANRRAARKEATWSRYRGVHPSRSRPGDWTALLNAGPKTEWLGTFEDEEDAARAYDRAALARFGAKAILNFPADAEPATPAELRDESWARYKERTTSQYIGVHWSHRAAMWVAQITEAGVHYRLGNYDQEAEAARAYDRAVMRLRGGLGRMNFAAERPRRRGRSR